MCKRNDIENIVRKIRQPMAYYFLQNYFATFICTFTKSPSFFVLAAWQCKCKLGSYALRADNVDIFTVGWMISLTIERPSPVPFLSFPLDGSLL